MYFYLNCENFQYKVKTAVKGKYPLQDRERTSSCNVYTNIDMAEEMAIFKNQQQDKILVVGELQ